MQGRVSAHVYRRDTCRLCNGRSLELVLPIKPTPIADAYIPAERLDEVQECYPLDLFLCGSCGHVQLLDVVDAGLLFGNYIYVTSSSLGLVAHFENYAEEVLRRVSCAKGSLVIEIGSNDGSLLRFFQNHGMRVLGVDPAHKIAEEATKSGVETLPSFFTAELARQIRRERGPAAIVTANNVFAHADDLAGMAEGIRDLLAPDGVFVFEVSYLVDVIEKTLFDTIYHEHLCYHSVTPLQAFFRRHGMELIDAERVGTKAGSLRCIVQLAGGRRTVSPSVARLTGLEASLGLERGETVRAFAARIEHVKNQLGGLLRDLKAQGKTIAGYGASPSVTTLIYHFELGDVLSFLVDDNPRKQGLFSPGHHIPVLPPQTIYERKPDYILILAWTYAQPIKKKLQTSLAWDGHFIVPLPQIEVT